MVADILVQRLVAVCRQGTRQALEQLAQALEVLAFQRFFHFSIKLGHADFQRLGAALAFLGQRQSCPAGVNIAIAAIDHGLADKALNHL